MAKQTGRDRLWTYALRVTHGNGRAITASDLANMANSSERSARDVLKTMTNNGFLRYDQKGREVRYVPDEL
mgnify:CR=1 FL=1